MQIGGSMTLRPPAFQFIASARLPMLAWVARIAGSNQAIVRHGTGVEVAGRFFAEAIWTEDFARGELLQSDCLFGSGGEILPDGIGFASSIAVTDWLFETIRDEVVFVSNSLPLLLAEAGDRLDPRFSGYAAINESIVGGISDYADTLPTEHGQVRRHVHRNLLVNQGCVTIQAKNLPPGFNSFEAYRDMLAAAAAALAENAASPARRHRLPIFSTQSKGYDSTCCNALMAPHGVRAVFTVSQGRSGGGYADRDAADQTDDDGTDIARALGLEVIAVDRRAFEAGIDHELLFWAGMQRNRDFNFVAIHVALRACLPDGSPAVLMGGAYGEIWYPSDVQTVRFSHPFKSGHIEDDTLKQRDVAHCGLSEVRLEVGYIQAALPFMGARRRPDIVAISNAPEMRPWRCVPGYDRPIARRIAEQAGVPRQYFGQVKRASAVEFPPPDVPRDAELRRAFERFLHRNRLASRIFIRLLPLVHRFNDFAEHISPRTNLLGYYATRAWCVLRRKDGKLPQLGRRLDGAIFCFAVNELVRRYGDTVGVRQTDG